jgi:hypothetical protein
MPHFMPDAAASPGERGWRAVVTLRRYRPLATGGLTPDARPAIPQTQRVPMKLPALLSSSAILFVAAAAAQDGAAYSAQRVNERVPISAKLYRPASVTRSPASVTLWISPRIPLGDGLWQNRPNPLPLLRKRPMLPKSRGIPSARRPLMAFSPREPAPLRSIQWERSAMTAR